MKNGPESRAPTDSVSLSRFVGRAPAGRRTRNRRENRNEQSNSCMGHASVWYVHTRAHTHTLINPPREKWAGESGVSSSPTPTPPPDSAPGMIYQASIVRRREITNRERTGAGNAGDFSPWPSPRRFHHKQKFCFTVCFCCSHSVQFTN